MPNFTSTETNQFSARALGGMRFVTAINPLNGEPAAGVTLAAGSGTWSSLSDRNAKENFKSVDPRLILEQVAALPLATWNYKSQPSAIRHLGPAAQDFKAVFGLGESDSSITTVDADGVALAAIQGLNEIVREKDAEIQVLKRSMAELKEIVSELTEQSKANTP